MIPPSSIQADVNYFLMLEADARGESPATFSSLELQIIAYGIRLAAPDVSDDLAETFLAVANAIDGLSELTDADHKYLQNLYNIPTP